MISRRTTDSRLDQFIHAPQTEFALVILILLSVMLVIAQVAIAPTSPLQTGLRTLEDLITVIFIIELTVRYVVARNKRRFFRNYWLDIVAVLPFSQAFRLLRILRLLRLLRVGILINRNLSRVSSTLAASVGIQIGILLMVGLIILVGAVSIYLLEGQQNQDFDSLNQSIWWSFFTLVAAEPTGGEPQTNAGRFVALLVAIGGLTMFAVFTGVVSAVMVERLQSVLEVRYVELDELRDHILICGWNRSGRLIVEELQADSETRHRSVVIVAEATDTIEHELRHLNRAYLYFYKGDYTTIDVLEEVGIYHAAQAILLADAVRSRSDQDRDARTVLAALTIEKLNPNIHSCAQLLDRKNNVQLRVAGVEDVIVADEMTSHLIATSVRSRGAAEVLSELLTVQMGNQFYKFPVPPEWVGMTFWEVSQQLKQQFDALLIAIERPISGQRRTLVNPGKDELLQTADSLVAIASQMPHLS
jgi:voltage-gated potassium channel